MCQGGRRVLSRAKRGLQITMPNSVETPQRRWGFGLADNDFVAFIKWTKTEDRSID